MGSELYSIKVRGFSLQRDEVSLTLSLNAKMQLASHNAHQLNVPPSCCFSTPTKVMLNACQMKIFIPGSDRVSQQNNNFSHQGFCSSLQKRTSDVRTERHSLAPWRKMFNGISGDNRKGARPVKYYMSIHVTNTAHVHTHRTSKRSISVTQYKKKVRNKYNSSCYKLIFFTLGYCF